MIRPNDRRWEPQVSAVGQDVGALRASVAASCLCGRTAISDEPAGTTKIPPPAAIAATEGLLARAKEGIERGEKDRRGQQSDAFRPQPIVAQISGVCL